MTETLYNKVQIPNKYDIIPIHTSDVASFLRCRRYWDWSSPARNNLRHRVEIYGINTNFWFGNGIHYALEVYYNPALRRDPVEAFQTWFQYQWEGGVVTEDWLDRTYDVNPERVMHPMAEGGLDPGSFGGHPYSPNEIALGYGGMDDPRYQKVWKIKGLNELLPDPRHEEFEELRMLGIGMMEFYKEWAPKNDNFEVVAAEAQFSVPLVTDNRRILTAVDIREESPNFGKMLEVHARGKRDTIIYDRENDQYGLIDYKTASKIDEDYFLKLENDPQCSNYMWASQMEAVMYDLPWRVMGFIDYQAMWKAYPNEVMTLSDGISPSLDRSKQSCTADMFAKYIQDAGLVDWFEDNPKAVAFYDFLVAEGDKRFINRYRTYRSQAALRTTGEELAMIAEEMLSKDLKVYKRPSGDRNCTRCVFRPPCLAKDDGADYMDMLKDGYEGNRDR